MTVCYHCMKEFSFFRKEYGCGKCGKCTCHSCLATADQVKSLAAGSAASLVHLKHVCLHCLRRAGDPTSADDIGEREPPKSLAKMQDRLSKVKTNEHGNKDLEKRLQELKNNQKTLPPSSTNTKSLSNDDIKKRIETLKPKQDEIPSTEELIRRLQILKSHDNPPKKIQNSQPSNNIYPSMNRDDNDTSNPGISGQHQTGDNDCPNPKDRSGVNIGHGSTNQPRDYQLNNIDFKSVPKSEKEQIDDIMKETIAEVRMIQKEDCEDCDNEELEFRLKKQILEEMALDDMMGEKLESELKADGQSVQWCCICNEDAVLFCSKCDDDLYCRSCFSRGHTSREYKNHKATELKKK